MPRLPANSLPERQVLEGVPFRGEAKPPRGMGCNPMDSAHGHALLSLAETTAASVPDTARPTCACECESERCRVSLSVQQRKNVTTVPRKNVTTEQRLRLAGQCQGCGLTVAVDAARMAAGPGGAERRLIYLKNTTRQNRDQALSC
jgi:hypothetical protein